MPCDKDELREIIREVMMEEKALHYENGGMRRREMERFKTPDGKEFISTTIERAEMLRKVAMLAAFFVALVIAGLGLWWKVEIEPRNREFIRAELAQHSADARDRMKEVAKQYALKSDFDTFVADKEQRWRAQDRFNERVELVLIDIQKDTKELLRRR